MNGKMCNLCQNNDLKNIFISEIKYCKYATHPPLYSPLIPKGRYCPEFEFNILMQLIIILIQMYVSIRYYLHDFKPDINSTIIVCVL